MTSARRGARVDGVVRGRDRGRAAKPKCSRPSIGHTSSSWTGFLGCIPTDHLDIKRAGAKTADQLDVDLVMMYRKLAARVAPL